MAFPFGSLWAVHQERINNFVKSHYKASLFPLLFFVLLLEALSLRITLGIGYNFFAVIFAATVVVVSMKIRVGNAVLVWCGMNLFPLYIYQRVPMRAFSEYFTGMMDGIGMWAYIVICMLITCAIAYVYRWVEIKIE